MCVLKTSRPHSHQQWDTTSTYRYILPSSISFIFIFPFMMANFMCQKFYVPLCPAMWLNIILDVSIRVFLSEIKHLNQWILLSIMWVDLIQSVEEVKRLTSLKLEDRGSLFSRHTPPLFPTKNRKLQRNKGGPYPI